MNDDTWNIVVTTPDAVARDYPNILQQMAALEYSAVVIRGFYQLSITAPRSFDASSPTPPGWST